MKHQVVAPLTVAVGLFLSIPALAAPFDQWHDSAYRSHMLRFRQEGLRGDRTHAARMIETLRTVDDAEGCITLMHALAQMGDTDALSAFDHVIDTNKSPELVNYARAARAHLVAEDAAKGQPVKDRPAAVASRLLTELNLSVGDINKAVASYNATITTWKASLPPDDSIPPPAPVELFAMRELADIVYRGGRVSAAITEVDFTLDARSGLKVRLAALTREQRVSALIEEISHKEYPHTEGNFYAQLLEDEGPLANQMISKKLQAIKAHPNAYTGKWGLFGGVGTLYGVLDQTDTSDSIAAASPNTTTSGSKTIRIQYVPGY